MPPPDLVMVKGLMDEVFRLKEIITEEVSLVDNAANRRKFLIIKSEKKRSADMPPPSEIVKGQNGLFSPTTVIKMQQVQKDELFKLSTTALENLSKLIEATKAAEIDDAAEFPAEILDGLREVAKTVQEHADKIGGDTSGDPAPAGDGGTSDDSNDSDAALRKAANLHKQLLQEKIDAISSCLKAITSGGLSADEMDAHLSKVSDIAWSIRDTAKIANISKSADDVAKGAHWMTTMQDLFSQLKNAVDKVKPPAENQNVGAGHQPDASVLGSFNDAFAKVQTQIDDMKVTTAKVTELESVIKRQNQQIQDLNNGVDVPSSGDPVPVNKGKGDDESWPLDMNAPDK